MEGKKDEKNYTGIIPENEEGKIIDTTSSIDFDTDEEAKTFFTVVKSRLLDVNRWHDTAGALSASFQLVDESCKEVDRPVQKGDYFKIDIPGPGTASGEGYDWVKVEDLQIVSEGDVESVGLRVRPVPSPVNEKKDIAHFYSEDSTSSFTVTREKNKITAGIYDRNTKPNKDAETVVDKVRDTVAGTGAVTIFSKLQWKSLANGLLSRKE